jgi:hypothetical protein
MTALERQKLLLEQEIAALSGMSDQVPADEEGLYLEGINHHRIHHITLTEASLEAEKLLVDGQEVEVDTL